MDQELWSKVKRFENCHIWEEGDRLSQYTDSTEILIPAGDIRELIYQDVKRYRQRLFCADACEHCDKKFHTGDCIFSQKN